MKFAISSFIIALVIAGSFIVFNYGWISSIQNDYGVVIDDQYKDSYNKIDAIANNYSVPMQRDIESELPTATESTGYFRGLDRVWQIIKTPFTFINFIGDLTGSVIKDLHIPLWVDWKIVITTIMTLLLIFLIISAVMKWVI